MSNLSSQTFNKRCLSKLLTKYSDSTLPIHIVFSFKPYRFVTIDQHKKTVKGVIDISFSKATIDDALSEDVLEALLLSQSRFEAVVAEGKVVFMNALGDSANTNGDAFYLDNFLLLRFIKELGPDPMRICLYPFPEHNIEPLIVAWDGADISIDNDVVDSLIDCVWTCTDIFKTLSNIFMIFKSLVGEHDEEEDIILYKSGPPSIYFNLETPSSPNLNATKCMNRILEFCDQYGTLLMHENSSNNNNNGSGNANTSVDYVVWIRVQRDQYFPCKISIFDTPRDDKTLALLKVIKPMGSSASVYSCMETRILAMKDKADACWAYIDYISGRGGCSLFLGRGSGRAFVVSTDILLKLFGVEYAKLEDVSTIICQPRGLQDNISLRFYYFVKHGLPWYSIVCNFWPVDQKDKLVQLRDQFSRFRIKHVLQEIRKIESNKQPNHHHHHYGILAQYFKEFVNGLDDDTLVSKYLMEPERGGGGDAQHICEFFMKRCNDLRILSRQFAHLCQEFSEIPTTMMKRYT